MSAERVAHGELTLSLRLLLLPLGAGTFPMARVVAFPTSLGFWRLRRRGRLCRCRHLRDFEKLRHRNVAILLAFGRARLSSKEHLENGGRQTLPHLHFAACLFVKNGMLLRHGLVRPRHELPRKRVFGSLGVERVHLVAERLEHGLDVEQLLATLRCVFQAFVPETGEPVAGMLIKPCPANVILVQPQGVSQVCREAVLVVRRIPVVTGDSSAEVVHGKHFDGHDLVVTHQSLDEALEILTDA
mmetsp:Transcript_3676/g.6577  ORF Transcript_3676/g.6577 Transcript_3676/m.6577 type:complete len:243 (+) Transcript_3676:194-922(+)